MNPGEFFRTHVGAMISQGFVADVVRDRLDLKGASEVWGGPDSDDHPAWYFWLTSSPGAYRLGLSHAEVLDQGGEPVPRGVFSVKYYPSPFEPVFHRFSRRERALIEGEMFDETNTPRLEIPDRIPESLFAVGTIEITRDLGRGQAFLKYVSLDRMRIGNPHSDPGGNDLSVGAPSPTRVLPAWDLGYPLFDAIVGLEAFLSRRAPKRVMLSRQAGFEFVESETGTLEPRDCEQAALKSLLLIFFPQHGNGPSPVEETIRLGQRTHPWTPEFEAPVHRSCGSGHRHHHRHGAAAETSAATPPVACGRCHGPHGIRSPTLHEIRVGESIWEVPVAFNEQWWTLSEADRTANTMPCGCQ